MIAHLLAKHIDAVQLELLRAAQHVIPQQDAIDETQQSTLQYLCCQLVDFVVLIKEDGFEGLPVLDVPTMQVEVLLSVLGREGHQQGRDFGVAALCDHQLFNINNPWRNNNSRT